MPDDELVPEGGPESPAEKRDEEARQFILQIPTISTHRSLICLCLIWHPVFSELREQNHDFFKEYYSMHDLKKQREKLGRLIQAYHAGSVRRGARAGDGGDGPCRRSHGTGHHGRHGVVGPPGSRARFVGGGTRQQFEFDRRRRSVRRRRAPATGRPALSGQQLRYQQEQPVYFPADQQLLQYQKEQAGQLPVPAEQQLHYQQQDLHAWLQLHYQERDLLTRQQLIQQQLLYYQYQEQLMANNGGFHVAPPALAVGLPRDTMMDPWPLSQDGMGWGQEQQDDLPPQGWPGAGADPSSTLPGGDQQLGNQNFYSSNAGSIHEHPQ
ncbi:unnamed protein product [Urochloa decumbens]|uniref:Uncharacterized protein n=1 Tax=Urochloa decumbens TaxID=240449 RepID=A0ABC8ZVA0_9POAL